MNLKETIHLRTFKELTKMPLSMCLSQKRKIYDYLGSLKVNKYSISSKTIRAFKDDDLGRILEIYAESFENKDPRQLVKYSKKFRNTLYIYEIDGVIVGYLGFYVHLMREGLNIVQKATAYSGAVDQNMRGRGIFTAMHTESLSELKKNGVQWVYAYINIKNTRSLSVNQKLGFKIIKKINNYYGTDDGYKIGLKL